MTLLCPEAERLYALAIRLEREGHTAAAGRLVVQAGKEAQSDMARNQRAQLREGVEIYASEDGQDD